MSNLLQLNNGVKSYGIKELFKNASFSINEGEHVGVIGPNGAGKSTLFKVLIGDEELDSGLLSKSRQLRLGYLEQHDNWGPNESVEEYLSKNSQVPIWDLKAWGRGLGIPNDYFSRPITSLSGGYRTRCKLLYLMAGQPNLMLLDEPTNYLDLETLLYLETFLREFKGAFLLISHDREFLRRTTDHILEIESGEMTKYNGSLDDYFEQKELLRSQLQSRALTQEGKRKEILDFVARFGAKASKARQAQSRLKSLEKMEKIEIKELPVKAKIKVPPPAPLPKLVYKLENVIVGYQDKPVLKDVSLEILRTDHIGVIGFNGAGKSTLLKSLAGMLPPLSGEILRAESAKVGLFAQHVAESLDSSQTVLESLTEASAPGTTTQDILNVAGSLLFSGDDTAKKISVLSGGERSRVALGRILLSGASVLIMDEPTNHLDFETVEALAEALKTFSGAIVVVSHDRLFLKKVSTKILEVRNGSVNTYPGTYDEYVWSLQQGILSTLENQTPELVKQNQGPAEKTEKVNSYRLTKEIESLLKKSEKKLENLQQEIKSLDDKLASHPNGWDVKLSDDRNALQLALHQEEETWLALSEQREVLKK